MMDGDNKEFYLPMYVFKKQRIYSKRKKEDSAVYLYTNYLFTVSGKRLLTLGAPFTFSGKHLLPAYGPKMVR